MAALPAVALLVAAAALLLCSPATAAAGGPHMADLSVLLPPRMTRPVEYRLVGGDGCFSWYILPPSLSPPFLQLPTRVAWCLLLLLEVLVVLAADVLVLNLDAAFAMRKVSESLPCAVTGCLQSAI